MSTEVSQLLAFRRLTINSYGLFLQAVQKYQMQYDKVIIAVMFIV